ncbi:hypothetical protein [Gemmobacter sp.]|uniref:hypothetical protein n=1 Tax=Gemmobacter sp. TaxID=1898957 RepID=UPI002AFF5C05|nr:hypothetical protein [Gemmobacter sp.]
MFGQERQIEGTAILGLGQVQVIIVDLVPAKGHRLVLAQAGRQQEAVEGGVDGILDGIDSLFPRAKIINDPL